MAKVAKNHTHAARSHSARAMKFAELTLIGFGSDDFAVAFSGGYIVVNNSAEIFVLVY